MASESSCHEEVRKLFEGSHFNQDIETTLQSMAEKVLLEVSSASDDDRSTSEPEKGLLVSEREMSLVELESKVYGERELAEKCLQEISDFWKELECST